MAPGIGQVSGSQASVTRSGVSEGALTVADQQAGPALANLNRDVTTGKDTAQALTKGWNGAQALDQVGAQMQITSAAMPRLAKEIGDYADAKVAELKQQGNADDAAKWVEGGIYRVAAHAALGVHGGGLSGAFGAAAASEAAPALKKVQDDLKNNLANAGLSQDAATLAAKLIAGGTAAAIGGAAGGSAGAMTGLNAELNNRQLHAPEKSLAMKIAKIAANAAAGGITNPDGTPVTAAQVENAMRAANNAQYGETAATGGGGPIKCGHPCERHLRHDGHEAHVRRRRQYQPRAGRIAAGDALAGTAESDHAGHWGHQLAIQLGFAVAGATAPGAPANPVGAEDTNPRFYTCASADCLLYGANRNSANPQNMAEDRNVNIKLAAGGIILGAPLAVAAGAPPLTAMATTAQTVPLAGGLAGVSGFKWGATLLAGSAIGAGSNYISDPDASLASMTVAGVVGALGGWHECNRRSCKPVGAHYARERWHRVHWIAGCGPGCDDRTQSNGRFNFGRVMVGSASDAFADLFIRVRLANNSRKSSMKPDSNPPGIPFNFHAIPLWLKPDLWDETKKVRCRGLLFVVLYTLSMAVFVAIIAVPAGIYKGKHMMGTTALIWLALSLPGGLLTGLAAWWDFVRASRKIADEAANAPQVEKPSNLPEDRKD
jgi:hypothetical protein